MDTFSAAWLEGHIKVEVCGCTGHYDGTILLTRLIHVAVPGSQKD